MTALLQLLSKYRDGAKTEREKGTYFEKLVKIFFENDVIFKEQFSKVYTFAEWAKIVDKNTNDIGIDLVAKNIDDEFYTAIQCKFYDDKSTIAKSDIDSFMAASDNNYFTRRILVDTTERGFNNNVTNQLENSSLPFTRLTINELENSSIDWSFYNDNTLKVTQKAKKQIRPHQRDALLAVQKGFSTNNRGKLIMACGTGKTFTALKIAEHIAGNKKNVLFLVPSLALMSQTITDWCIEADIPLHSFAVCSDTQVGKRKSADDDISDIDIHDLIIPATTDANKLALAVAKYTNKDAMLVIFATYQSIEVVSKAQLQFNMPEFDLIICDEAHRTTGAKLNGADESDFVKIHDNKFIKGNKRLYMTATPRVYIDAVKTKATEVNATVYSMDDITHYGEVFYSLKFGEAVESGLLSDYKVLVLAVDEKQVARDIQCRLSEDDELKLDDASKIIGCYKALIKNGASFNDKKPMQKAVAFCNSIKNSQLFVREFKAVVNEYLKVNTDIIDIDCELDHVDGKMNATEKTKKLSWLKENTENTCRILSNARCLSEGVDVPSLDAVMFIHSRKSKVYPRRWY
jgi:predicted helicase